MHSTMQIVMVGITGATIPPQGSPPNTPAIWVWDQSPFTPRMSTSRRPESPESCRLLTAKLPDDDGDVLSLTSAGGAHLTFDVTTDTYDG
ncbi:MAG: hypothetical protein ACYCXA_02055 [Actinomycetes bacterium]